MTTSILTRPPTRSPSSATKRLPRLRSGAGLAADRGASMVEYGLLTALFVLAVLAASEMLVDRSAQGLADNSSQIGTPRPYLDQLVVTTLPNPAQWAVTTVPVNGFTLYDSPIRDSADKCWTFSKRLVEMAPCSPAGGAQVEPDLTQLYSLEHYEEDYRVTTAVTGECLVAKGRAGAAALPKPCDGAPDEVWRVQKLGDYTFTLRSVFSGFCADATSGTLKEEVCAGVPGQTFTVGFPPAAP